MRLQNASAGSVNEVIKTRLARLKEVIRKNVSPKHSGGVLTCARPWLPKVWTGDRWTGATLSRPQRPYDTTNDVHKRSYVNSNA